MALDTRCWHRVDFDGGRCVLRLDHDGPHEIPPSSRQVNPTIIDESRAESFAADEKQHERITELAQWWREQAESEIEQTAAKAVEYSGLLGGLPADLVDLGRQIAFVQRREHEFTDAELAEIGVWSYIQGKVNRWSSALRNGRMVSQDSLLDIGVYVRIAERIRQTGQWP